MVKDAPPMHIPYAVLLQYITQKICHDMATPVGAIRLGLENLFDNQQLPTASGGLMEKNDAMSAEITPLIMQSLDSATTRIEVFRQLFSLSKHPLDPKRVGKLLGAYLSSKNVKCQVKSDTSDHLARLMLGLGVVACEALPRGGTITLDFDDGVLECSGPIVHMPYTSFDRASLLNEDLKFKSGIILFHVLYLAEEQGLKLTFDQEAGGLVLAFVRDDIGAS